MSHCDEVRMRFERTIVLAIAQPRSQPHDLVTRARALDGLVERNHRGRMWLLATTLLALSYGPAIHSTPRRNRAAHPICVDDKIGGVSVKVQVSLEDGAAEMVTLSSAEDPASVSAALAAPLREGCDATVWTAREKGPVLGEKTDKGGEGRGEGRGGGGGRPSFLGEPASMAQLVSQ